MVTTSVFKDSNELRNLISATIAKYPSADEAYGTDSIVMHIKIVFKKYTTAQLQNLPFMKKIFLGIYAAQGYPMLCSIMTDLWSSLNIFTA